MTQFGCATACAGVTLCKVSGSRRRNGPPLAVSTMWSMCRAQALRSCGRHWNTAECSLSMGSKVAPPSATARMKSPPPTTSASLLASSKRLPARAAAMHGGRPAAPTMAAITLSTSSAAASSHKACAPACTSVAEPCSRNARRNSAARSGLGSTATRGRQRRHCCTSTSTRCMALRPTTSKRSGWRATTSSVLVPTEPVEPNIARRWRGGVMARPAPSEPAPRAARAAGRPRGRARRRARAAGGCCPWPPPRA